MERMSNHFFPLKIKELSMHTAKQREKSKRDYILYDSIYITFQKWQSYRESKREWFPGLWHGELQR
jgi:hypothetical protein